MDTLQKLRLLGEATAFEPAEEVGVCQSPPPDVPAGIVYNAVLPGGAHIPLLKTLLTSACEMDCAYCPFRQGRDFRRATFTPDELADLFLRLHRAGTVEGLFLSSGIAGGGPRTADRLIATAEILRRKHHFRGYIHLKIMPGAERAQVEAAMQLADRVSINLEAPTADHLAALAPHKEFATQLWERLRWVEEIRRRDPGRRWPSSTTQFVVGAVGESDRELLTAVERLHREAGIARAYFSSFRPIPDTPLEHQPPPPPAREQRLYQSSFLLRDYGFAAEELPFDAAGNLPLDSDPKLAWARSHLAESPVELNTAARPELLRVPGIGPASADKIIRERRRGRLRYLSDLRQLGIAARRAAPFILLDGRRPARQLQLAL